MLLLHLLLLLLALIQQAAAAVYTIRTSERCPDNQKIYSKKDCEDGAIKVKWSDTSASVISSDITPNQCYLSGNILYMNQFMSVSETKCSSEHQCLCKVTCQEGQYENGFQWSVQEQKEVPRAQNTCSACLAGMFQDGRDQPACRDDCPAGNTKNTYSLFSNIFLPKIN